MKRVSELQLQWELLKPSPKPDDIRYITRSQLKRIWAKARLEAVREIVARNEAKRP